MLGKLKGIVDQICADHIILDVSGIGFEVQICSSDLPTLREGDPLQFFIYTQIREQDISLFGFKCASEKNLFIELLKVKGIGGKLAISILGQMKPAELVRALNGKDKNAIKQLSGVGPKLAERIIAELAATKFDISFNEDTENKPVKSRGEALIQDALSALINLGYNKNESTQTATFVYENNENLSLSELIRLSLKELTK